MQSKTSDAMASIVADHNITFAPRLGAQDLQVGPWTQLRLRRQ